MPFDHAAQARTRTDSPWRPRHLTALRHKPSGVAAVCIDRPDGAASAVGDAQPIRRPASLVDVGSLAECDVQVLRRTLPASG